MVDIGHSTYFAIHSFCILTTPLFELSKISRQLPGLTVKLTYQTFIMGSIATAGEAGM